MGMTKNLVNLTLGAVIVVLILVVVAVPIISGTAEDNVRTAALNTTQVYTMTQGEDLTIEISISSNTLTIGDYQTTTLTEFLISDNVYMTVLGGTIRVTDIVAGINNVSTNAVSIVDGAYTFTSGGNSVTGTITGKCYYAQATGDYGVFAANASGLSGLKISPDSTIEISSLNRTYTNTEDPTDTTSYITALITANPSTGWEVTYLGYPNNGEFVEITTAVATGGAFSETDGYYQITTLPTISFTDDDKTYSQGAYNTILAPLKYTYHSSSDNAIISMLNIIPLLIIVGVILAIVGTVFYTRMKM